MPDDEPTTHWASSADVLALWVGGNKPTDAAQVQLFCQLAEAVILRDFSTLITRVEGDESGQLGLLAKLVVVQLVQGIYKNPDRMKYFQQSNGPFVRSGNVTDDLLKLMSLTDEQKALLATPKLSRGGMIDLDPNPDRVFGRGWDRDIMSTL